MQIVTEQGGAAPERVVPVSEDVGFDAGLASIVSEDVNDGIEVADWS